MEADSGTGRARPTLPADLTSLFAQLHHAAVYAVAVEAAVARGPALRSAIVASLAEGRPCALLTPLEPDEPEFVRLLAGASGAGALTDALADGRLRVFTLIGDFATNLFRFGAAGLLRELDHYGIADGSVVVVDQADDLFTLHDHTAVVQQAKAYAAWTEARRGSMVMLHLRAGASRPLLEGNQAAVSLFAGAARLRAAEQALRCTVEHWHAAAGSLCGTELRFAAPLHGGAAEPAGAQGGRAPSAPDGPIDAPAIECWHVGGESRELAALAPQVRWHWVGSVRDVLAWGVFWKGSHVLISLDDEPDLLALANEVSQLRAALGAQARVVVRESRRRLREHSEKKLLLAAGVRAVVDRQEPSNALLALLGASDSDGRTPQGLGGIDPQVAPDRLAALAQRQPGGYQPAPRFFEHAAQLLRTSRELGIPCTLAELLFEEEIGRARPGAGPVQARFEDLSTTLRHEQIVLLHGCPEQGAIQAVRRWTAIGRSLRRLHLCADNEAIDQRLGQLRRGVQEGPGSTDAAPSDSTARNVVPLPGPTRAGRSALVSVLGAWLAVAALLWAGMDGAAAQTATTEPPSAAPALNATQAYAEGRYADAARSGLLELRHAAHDHTLRFKVANSLAWTGRYKEAIAQYEALAGTPLAAEAMLGLAFVHLWDGRPELADPLFRKVLAAAPHQAAEVNKGLAAAGRQLRPRSSARLSAVADSNDAERRMLGLAHRWRDVSLRQVFEVTVDAGQEERSPDVPDQEPREVGFAYELLGESVQPRVHVVAQDSPASKLFAGLAVKLAGGALTLEIARLNWGKLVFDPRALRDGLTARRAGASFGVDSIVGRWQGSAAQFDVSDGNRLREASLRYTPAWQPLQAGVGVRFFAGLYSREAERPDGRYWSPAGGYYTADLGASLGHWGAQWEFYGEAKRSLRLGGEGADGWAASATARHWLNSDWSLRADVGLQRSVRDASRYRAQSLAIALDRLW